MEQQLNSSTGGWIGDDRRDESDFASVSQTIAKPIVSGSIKSEHEVINEYYPTINHAELGELYCRDKVILIMREYAEQFK